MALFKAKGSERESIVFSEVPRRIEFRKPFASVCVCVRARIVTKGHPNMTTGTGHFSWPTQMGWKPRHTLLSCLLRKPQLGHCPVAPHLKG